MGIVGLIVLVVGAVVLGFLGQASGTRRSTHEWLIFGVAALVGAALASEWLFPTGWAELDGLALLPALLGAVVLGGAVELIFRLATRPAEPAHPSQ